MPMDCKAYVCVTIISTTIPGNMISPYNSHRWKYQQWFLWDRFGRAHCTGHKDISAILSGVVVFPWLFLLKCSLIIFQRASEREHNPVGKVDSNRKILCRGKGVMELHSSRYLKLRHILLPDRGDKNKLRVRSWHLFHWVEEVSLQEHPIQLVTQFRPRSQKNCARPHNVLRRKKCLSSKSNGVRTWCLSLFNNKLLSFLQCIFLVILHIFENTRRLYQAN